MGMGTVISIIILMFAIAIFLDNKKEEKNNAERNAEEFMKKHFGEDYKDKINHR